MSQALSYAIALHKAEDVELEFGRRPSYHCLGRCIPRTKEAGRCRCGGCSTVVMLLCGKIQPTCCLCCQESLACGNLQSRQVQTLFLESRSSCGPGVHPLVSGSSFVDGLPSGSSADAPTGTISNALLPRSTTALAADAADRAPASPREFLQRSPVASVRSPLSQDRCSLGRGGLPCDVSPLGCFLSNTRSVTRLRPDVWHRDGAFGWGKVP